MPTPITPMRRSRTAIYFSSPARFGGLRSCTSADLRPGKAPGRSAPCCRPRAAAATLPGVDTAQLVAELLQLLAAGHLPGQLVQRELVAVGVEDHPAELEDDEVVAHQVGVVRVVGDEDDPEAGVARLDDVLQHHPGLLHAECGGRLVEDHYLGAEVDRPGDRDALALAAGQHADRPLEVGDDDAHLGQLLVGDPLHLAIVQLAEGPLVISLPRKKLRHTDISGASARSW